LLPFAVRIASKTHFRGRSRCANLRSAN